MCHCAIMTITAEVDWVLCEISVGFSLLTLYHIATKKTWKTPIINFEKTEQIVLYNAQLQTKWEGFWVASGDRFGARSLVFGFSLVVLVLGIFGGFGIPRFLRSNNKN